MEPSLERLAEWNKPERSSIDAFNCGVGSFDGDFVVLAQYGDQARVQTVGGRCHVLELIPDC